MTNQSQLSLQLKAYEKKIDARTLRERVLLSLAAGAVIFTLWLTLVHEPVRTQAQSLEKSIKEAQQNKTFAQEESAILAQMPKDKRLANTEKEVERLSAHLARVEQDIATHSRAYVQPQEMAKMMRRLLSTSDVTLVQLKTLKPPTIRLTEETSADPSVEQQALKQPDFYEFPLELDIEGEFFELADFLARVEQLPWRIFWDQLSYEVAEFPNARLKLRVHTLGPEKHWLGV